MESINGVTRKFYPFKDNSNDEFKENNKTFEFWIFITTVLCVCLGLISMGVLIFLKNDILAVLLISLIFLSFIGFLLLFIFLMAYGYGFFEFLRECKIRKFIKNNPEYIPLEYRVLDKLNSVVKMEGGEMYRQYQFINAEMSGVDYIVVELPSKLVGTIPVNEYSSPREDEMCIFERLSEVEMSNILVPIKKHYEDLAYRKKLIKEEAYTKKQSEYNSRITNEDIQNLPLFKSLKAISDKNENEIECYRQELKTNLRENKEIIDKIK